MNPRLLFGGCNVAFNLSSYFFFVHKATQALSGAMYFTGSVLFRVGCREFLQLLSCIGICVRFLHFFDFFFVVVLFLLADNSQVNLTCQVCSRNPRLVSTRRTPAHRPYDQIPV